MTPLDRFDIREMAHMAFKFKGFPYYWGAVAETKCLRAVLFSFLPGKRVDRAALNACTGWVRHMGRFYENRTYEFVLDAQLTNGDVEVQLLDQKKQPILKLNRQCPSRTIDLDGEKSRYYLRWEFHGATGKCELRW